MKTPLIHGKFFYKDNHERSPNPVRHAIEQGLFGNTSFNRIPVRCVETGVVYPSSKDAGIACNSPDGACVSRCVKGKQRTAHGFHWERATTRS